MTYRETCILLPCHSLEDFPMHHEGEDADGLLAAWTSLWHPALLAATGSAPTWRRGDSPPQDPSGMLIVAPGVSRDELPTGFPDRARVEGACFLVGNLSREELLAEALQPVSEVADRIDPELVADFLALGYGYLQIELLTRQMRYSTNLDEVHFYNQAVAGAKAAAEGDVEKAREQLTACFDLLAQERDHYYAVDAYVLDVTLLAPTTLGAPLVEQLAPQVPVNLLLNASLLQRMRTEVPDSFAALERGVEQGYVGLIGGELTEERVPLQSCETALQRLKQGLACFDEMLGCRPHVYGRLRYGISVLHPQLLNRLGFIGALHTALAEGRYPEGSQLKVRWEGPDHQAIDALSRVPLNAAKGATFLSLASKLGETMDMDHVATLCLAHWPGRVSPWYHDLRRVARHGALLGKFITADDYFRDTDYPGQTEQFKADQYRSPYLHQSVTRGQQDPLSTSVRYWRNRTRASAVEALETMVQVIDGKPVERHASRLIAQIDAHADDPCAADLADRLEELEKQLACQFAERMPRADSSPVTGYLFVNTSSSVQRAAEDLPALESLPAVDKPIYAAAEEGAHKYAVLDVPPMGFAWVHAGQAPSAPARQPKVLAEEYRLFNEYFELHVSPQTGGLQSLYEYEKRGNRLSQQLAVRGARGQQAGSQGDELYSRMVADQVRITASSPVMGEIVAQGRLLDRGDQILANYEQTYRLWRGRRVLELDVRLEPLVELQEDPWRSYFCSRLAWASESAILWRAVNQLRERAEAKQLEAPNYIDIDDDGRHVTLLTGGLPYHRRSGLRMLDTLLVVQGESARTFRLGIGIDLAYPLQESFTFMAPAAAVELAAPPPAGATSGWLFHIDSRNVTVTAWTPVVEQDAVVGFAIRVLETAGRAARATIRSCRSVLSAERRDFTGKPTGPLTVRDGAMRIELGANEWTEVVARWTAKPETETAPD